MGPNVKFVSAITDGFYNKKWGQFFSGKEDQTRGGAEGGLVKDHTFAAFFLNPSLSGHSHQIPQRPKSLGLLAVKFYQN